MEAAMKLAAALRLTRTRRRVTSPANDPHGVDQLGLGHIARSDGIGRLCPMLEPTSLRARDEFVIDRPLC